MVVRTTIHTVHASNIPKIRCAANTGAPDGPIQAATVAANVGLSQGELGATVRGSNSEVLFVILVFVLFLSGFFICLLLFLEGEHKL